MTEKPCRTCEKVLPVLAFAKAGTGRGHQMYRSDCKTCVNAEMRRLRGCAKRVHENKTYDVSPHPRAILKFAWVGYRGQSPLEGEVNKAVAA